MSHTDMAKMYANNYDQKRRPFYRHTIAQRHM